VPIRSNSIRQRGSVRSKVKAGRLHQGPEIYPAGHKRARERTVVTYLTRGMKCKSAVRSDKDEYGDRCE
jgi:hypothetical protein